MESTTTQTVREKIDVDRQVILEIVISENLELLRQVFDNATKQANYGFFEAGIRSAFHKLNSLLPANFRKGLTYEECCCLNEKIREMLRSAL